MINIEYPLFKIPEINKKTLKNPDEDLNLNFFETKKILKKLKDKDWVKLILC